MRYAGFLLAVLAAPRATLGSVVHGTQGVTPVEKVVQLLKKLSAQIEDEGKAEAAQYDKYACFCKEQADNKLYSIERSQRKNDAYQARINELEADIAELSADITTLGGVIGELEAKVKVAQESRSAAHKVYIGQNTDVTGAIDAIERAIATLKESKGQLGGKVELEAMVQLRQVAGHALRAAVTARSALSDSQLDTLSSFTKLGQPGEVNQYSYHSNDIIDILEGLKRSFKEQKQSQDTTEFEANAAFEKLSLGLVNEKTFRAKDKSEKEKLAESKTQSLHSTQQALTEETAAKTADEAFLKVLTEDCETKATLWDQRSKTRSSELTALSEALEALQSGVQPNFDANKKLVGLIRKQQAAAPLHVATPAVGPVQPAATAKRPVSFLQLRGSAASTEVIRQKVLRLLSDAAGRLRSPILSAAALKVQMAEDHFAKVRQLIKDLVARLEQQKAEEATTKAFCDTSMAAAISKRDTKQGEVEDLQAQISQKNAEEAELNQEIAALSEAIAANFKALNEATELRNSEKADNERTSASAAAGKAAVEQAISVLKAFYEGASLMQRNTYVPPDSDRDGKTLADVAPQVFQGEYGGKDAESKGIFGLLEVILSDFERTIASVTEQESAAAADFDTFKQANEADTEAKQGEVTTKKDTISEIKDALVTLESTRRDAAEQHELALKELEQLNATCVAGEESYEERVAKRKAEIEALKEARAILEEWKP